MEWQSLDTVPYGIDVSLKTKTGLVKVGMQCEDKPHKEKLFLDANSKMINAVAWKPLSDNS